MVNRMTVMRGAYDGRPYAVTVPVIDNRGALPSPGGWRAADPAWMAIRILLLLLLLRRRYSVLNMVPPWSSTSSIWSISFLLNPRATAVFNVLVARCSLYNYLFQVFALLSGLLRRALDLDLSPPACDSLLELVPARAPATTASQPALTAVVEWPGSALGAQQA